MYISYLVENNFIIISWIRIGEECIVTKIKLFKRNNKEAKLKSQKEQDSKKNYLFARQYDDFVIYGTNWSPLNIKKN